jgi:hypothetical protein
MYFDKSLPLEDTFNYNNFTKNLGEMIEKSKTVITGFNHFVETNWPAESLPGDLESLFTVIMNASVEKEKNYVVKHGWNKLKITETCNLFSYYTARSVIKKEIPFVHDGYPIKDIFLVRVRPRPNSNASNGTAGSFFNISFLKSATGSKNFMHEDGSIKGVWNYHMTVVFAVQDSKGNMYFAVADPFLYKRSVSFSEWINRFDRNSVVEIKRFQKDDELDKNRFFHASKK